jgi:hypothetical protein
MVPLTVVGSLWLIDSPSKVPRATLLTLATDLGPIMCLTFLDRTVIDARNMDALFLACP